MTGQPAIGRGKRKLDYPAIRLFDHSSMVALVAGVRSVDCSWSKDTGRPREGLLRQDAAAAPPHRKLTRSGVVQGQRASSLDYDLRDHT
jgi:hypothetical protein